MFGSSELILVIVVIVVLFGASAIPKFARSIGQAKSEFEKGLKEGREKSKNDAEKNGDSSEAKS